METKLLACETLTKLTQLEISKVTQVDTENDTDRVFGTRAEWAEVSKP